MIQPLPSPSPVGSPRASSTLWSCLDAHTQQQLAHCLSDLIRRMRSVPTGTAQENSHDTNAYGHQDH